MFNISSFLDKFSKSISSEEQTIGTVITAIHTSTGIDLSADKIEVKDTVIYITASPAIKNKIFIYKETILSSIVSFGIKVSDIR